VRSHDAVLFGCQDLAPFGIAARNCVGLACHCRFPFVTLRRTGYIASSQLRYPDTDPSSSGVRRWRIVSSLPEEVPANQVREELPTATLGLHRQRDDEA
jgi:hypothetical protein